jgi:hypothetical protein
MGTAHRDKLPQLPFRKEAGFDESELDFATFPL